MIEEVGKPSVLFVDPLATDRGHLIDDDLFFAECIAPLASEFLVATSPASVANIQQHLKVKTQEIEPFDKASRFTRIRLFRLAFTLPCSRFRHIIFQSFEEVSVLLFMLLHPGKCVHLIVTNNLRPDRLKRHPVLGRFFLRAVFQRAASVIIHCQHEADKVKELVPDIDTAKIFIKPFHQLSLSRLQLSWQEKSQTILFLGPELAHKKLFPVVDLIKSDKQCRYRYVFCAMRDDMSSETRAFLETRENVELLFGHVADSEYYRLFSEAALVILTHDEDFEGALSGAFCDAIASGTPVIICKMAPYDEFFYRFGPMGFLVDYANTDWCKHVLNADLSAMYEEFQQNVDMCRKSCSMESNRDVFRSIIGCSFG